MGILSNIKKIFAPFSDPDLNAVNSALIKTIEIYVPKEKYNDTYDRFRKSFLYGWERVNKGHEPYTGEVPKGQIEGLLEKNIIL